MLDMYIKTAFLLLPHPLQAQPVWPPALMQAPCEGMHLVAWWGFCARQTQVSVTCA